jgi:hypothetical protein
MLSYKITARQAKLNEEKSRSDYSEFTSQFRALARLKLLDGSRGVNSKISNIKISS